jgi:hypothetical protein
MHFKETRHHHGIGQKPRLSPMIELNSFIVKEKQIFDESSSESLALSFDAIVWPSKA